MTFDREPDLDNANVGMPDTRILGITKYIKEVTKSVASFFVVLEVFLWLKSTAWNWILQVRQ